MNDDESAFLWSVYSNNQDGIAIKSSIDGFKRSIEIESRDIYMGPVTYIDYKLEPIVGRNFLNPFFRKRNSFESEKELRACITHIEEGQGLDPFPVGNPKGIYIGCDLHELIDEVLIAPTAPQWYEDAISALVQKFGHKFVVRKSDIGSAAIF
jgi:hypothetical protein